MEAIMIFTFIILASLFVLAFSSQTCKNHTFSDNTSFQTCQDLPVLDSHLHWTHNPYHDTIQIAFRAKQTNPKGWIAWGINPTENNSMIGTQALVAFQDSKGKMKAYSTKITSYVPLMEPEPLSFPVSELSAEYFNNEMMISAILGPLSNLTNLNTVWQVGNSVSGGIPKPHPFLKPNLASLLTVNFMSEE